MDKDQAYAQIDSLEYRINFIMKIAGYFDIVYGLAMIPIYGVVWGIFPIEVTQGVASLILGFLILYRNSKLAEEAWLHQDTLLFLTILNTILGFVFSSIFILVGYLTRRRIEKLTIELEKEILE